MTAQTYRAVLVANSTFPADAYNLPDLEGPRNDPALLRDALCDRDVGLFAPDNVRLVTERTMSEVLSEAEDLLVSATRRDTLLIYYSGHGLLDQSGELFLCTRDSRSDRLRSTAVKASDLRGMMDASAAGTMVVVLDCCHSGRFKGSNIPATLSGRGRFVVTSSRPGELANDADVRNHASLFTHHLAEGIRSGAVDHDGDGIVTLSELYDYVRTALANEGRQVPQKRFEGDGDVALARRVADHVPADLVDPASSAPILDLSDTAIHLGEVGSDEHLPPERIAVINRGGGTLDWTAESSARWVEPVAEGGAVVLHLDPRPGPNRANVYVRETGGALKTIRVSVRVREPAGRQDEVTGPADPVKPPSPREESSVRPSPLPTGAEPAVAEPAVAEPAVAEPAVAEPAVAEPAGAEPAVAEPAVAEPAVAEPAKGSAAGGQAGEAQAIKARSGGGLSRWGDPRWWCAAVALFSVIVGIAIAGSNLDLVKTFESEHGASIMLRRLDYSTYGGPRLPGVMSGIALAAVGAVALALLGLQRLSSLAAVRSMACCFAIAVPWSLFLLGDAAALRHAGDGWMLGEVNSTAVTGWLVTLAGLTGVALFKAGAWRRGSWSPKRLRVGLTTVALLWAISLSVDSYTLYDEAYGSVFNTGSAAANIWYLLAGLSIVALIYAGLWFLAPQVGSWLIVTTAATPLVILTAEFAYLMDSYENPDSSVALLLMVVPTVALVGLAATVLVRSRREAADDGSEVVGEAAAT
jgi:Caspase domain